MHCRPGPIACSRRRARGCASQPEPRLIVRSPTARAPAASSTATIRSHWCVGCRTLSRSAPNFAETPQTLAGVDPYACNLRLEGIAAATHADLAAVFRLVPDQVNIVELPVDALPMLPLAPASDEATALACLVIREQAELLRVGGDADSFGGRAGSAVRATIGALRYGGREELIEAIERAGSDCSAHKRTRLHLLEVIEETLQSLAASGEARPQAICSRRRTPNRSLGLARSEPLAAGGRSARGRTCRSRGRTSDCDPRRCSSGQAGGGRG